MTQKTETSVIDDVISACGSTVSLIDALGISAAAITYWKQTGVVPVERCIEVEKLTGIKCERLNPKQDWAYLRAQPEGIQ